MHISSSSAIVGFNAHFQHNAVTFSFLGCPIPQRYVLAIMGFLAVVNAYAMRVSLSIAITEMVKPSNSSSENNYQDLCAVGNTNSSHNNAVKVKCPTDSFPFGSHLENKGFVWLDKNTGDLKKIQKRAKVNWQKFHFKSSRTPVSKY